MSARGRDSQESRGGSPIKVAVLGGGCAAIATAFELTRPENQGKYQVTVYQMGWRLGGKGASGRGPADRIEEHGLHLWMGFYENAFRLMRDCYAELARDPATCRIAAWTDAFVPAPFNAVTDRSPAGEWSIWKVMFPALPGAPGDDDGPRGARPSVAGYLVRCVSLLRTLLASLPTPDRNDEAVPGARATLADDETKAPTSLESLLAQVGRLMRYGELATLGALLEALDVMEMVLRALPTLPAVPDNILLALHGAVAAAVRRQLEALARSDDELRRLWEIADLVLTLLRGAVRFKLATDPRGFDAINDYDCREWLRMNGASELAVNSAFVRALYDLAFAYEDGDVARPRIAAGQALRGAVRAFFTYRGAFFWKMRTGMGDAVFAPFYEVLRRRGVCFEFFHRLENLQLGGGGPGERPHIKGIEFDVQADVRGSAAGYRPLVDVRGLPCWPSAPDFTQLVDGERLRREGWDFESPWETRCAGKKQLVVGEDFDFVVLGVGVGAVPRVARELVARDSRWAAMVKFVKSVPTQAFQIWLNSEMHELGWPHGAANVSGFVEPFDTWADMTHLVAEESFATPPGAIAYFCSVLRDEPDRHGEQYIRERTAEVKGNAMRFLNEQIGHLWPRAQEAPGRFRWKALADGNGRSVAASTAERSAAGRGADQKRFDSQYWRANVTPSDRYSLALPGSLRYRISPLDNSYDNLTVAGDWTDCGFNEGCVEAAVMSGRLAAHALSQSPPLEAIVGYDHP